MPFVTKPDFSNNRQVKQFQLTNTALSGTTEFGVESTSLYELGYDSNSVENNLGFLSNIVSTFSGNTWVTEFVFGDPVMNVTPDPLNTFVFPFNNITSGDTQIITGFEGLDFVTIDGTSGKVLVGDLPLIKPEPTGDLAKIVEWSRGG